MTVLQIVTDACEEMGLDRPQSVTHSQNPQTRQLFALLRRLCVDLCRQYDWQQLSERATVNTSVVTQNITLTAGSNVVQASNPSAINSDFVVQADGIPSRTEVLHVNSNNVTLSAPASKSGSVSARFCKYRYALPEGFLRMYDNTLWQSGNRRRGYGGVGPMGWQEQLFSLVGTNLIFRYRIRHGKLEIYPVPSESGQLSYEYLSNRFVMAGGERVSSIQNDDDEILFDSSLLVLGLMYMFRQTNGLDASTELGAFQELLEKLKAQDNPEPELSISGVGYGGALISPFNIPDGSWNV